MKKLHLIPDFNNFDESMKLAESVDAAFEYNDFWLPAVLDNKAKVDELVDFYKKNRGDCSHDTIHGVFLDITIHSSDSQIKKASEYRIEQSMDVASRLGARGVVFHTNMIPNFTSPSYVEGWKNANRDYFTKLAAKYPDTDIYMENMFDISYEMLTSLAEEMKDVKNFGICYDYAHARVFGDGDFAWEESLYPYIRHMHINDNDEKVDLHLPVGAGNLDWFRYNNITRRMDEEGRGPSVLIEVNGIEKQKASIDYMKQHRLYPFEGN